MAANDEKKEMQACNGKNKEDPGLKKNDPLFKPWTASSLNFPSGISCSPWPPFS